MASTYLKRTNGTPTNDKIGTISAWVKRSKLGTDQRITMNFADGSNYAYLRFTDGDVIEVYGVASGSQSTQIRTNRKFRDTNAWYHIVLAIDTTQGTSTNRMKIYVNGVQETSMSHTDYWGQNETCQLLIASGSNYHTVGSAENGTSSFDGSMSHFHKCDGTALAPTVFGSTDSTTGEWKIETSPSFTLGNNGYTILKDGNTITDQSSNSNDFTLGAGTLTKTEDCPSNVFATVNPLDNYYAGGTFTEGNNTVKHGSSPWTYNTSTLKIPENTKFYFEAKVISMNQCTIGIEKNVSIGSDDYLGKTSGVGFRGNQGNVYKNGSDAGGTFATYTANDIISVACDTVNNRIFFGKNGTWLNSGDPTSSTGAITIDDDRDYFFALGDNTSGARGKWSANFGNGYFGTTAVSSAGTNASNIGIFEYDVPTGYTALSTKGLNL